MKNCFNSFICSSVKTLWGGRTYRVLIPNTKKVSLISHLG